MKQNFSMLLMAAFAITISGQALAQKKGKKPDPKHTNYFKDVEEAIEAKEVVMEFTNGIASAEVLKFKTKFTNNTNDFLLVDPSKFKISVAGSEMNPKEKEFLLGPNDKKSKTINLKERGNLHVDAFGVSVAGFSRISLDGAVAKAEDFQLPAATNVITADNFEINLKRLKQETQETWARFEIKYKGNDYGIVDPSRVSVVTESGKKFANDNRKSKTILLQKGDTKTISVIFHIPAKVVDMQLATLQVQWNNAFIETKSVPFEVDESVTFQLDEALTKEKN